MTAAERILEYRSLDQESLISGSSKNLPPDNWPAEGQIVLEDVSINHSVQDGTKCALQQISLTIHPAEKIGIVGRTGAGKSTLLQTLFRMVPLKEGCVKIDNIDISTVKLDDLRRKISVIPQDPMLFTDTIRANLDPFNNYSDEAIWEALEEVSYFDFYSIVRLNFYRAIGATKSFCKRKDAKWFTIDDQ